MRLLTCLIWVLIYPFWAQAQTFQGVSAFGALSPSYPCDTLLSILESAKLPAIAVLDQTFGQDLTCVSKFIDKFKDKPHLIEIHLLNYPGIKNRRGEPSDPFYNLSAPELCERVATYDIEIYSYLDRRIEELTSKLAPHLTNQTHLILSPLLESKCSPRAYTALKTHIDDYPLFWGVSHGRHGYDFWEHHSLTAKCDFMCIANEDGNLKPNSRKFRANNRKAFAVFYWRAEVSNGLLASGRFVPYRDRRFAISDKQGRELKKLLAGK